jgi:pimeloyl-ACP methyl ester carboxylesterase
MALVNRHLAKKAERDNPAAGRFLDVEGVRLHYVERGSGEPLVLLHGNGSMIEDLESTQPGTSASSFSTVPDSATATAIPEENHGSAAAICCRKANPRRARSFGDWDLPA